MTYVDDRTAGAMSDDERRNYVRQSGAAMTAPPDGPSRDLRERMVLNRCSLEAERSSCYAEVDDILSEIEQAGFGVVNLADLNQAVCDLVNAVERRGEMRAEVAWARLDALVPGLAESGPLEPGRYVLVDRERWERVYPGEAGAGR